MSGITGGEGITRRGLLGQSFRAARSAAGMTCLVAAGHALLGGRIPSYPAAPNRKNGFRPSPGLIRPPGAADEPDFLAGCIRCYRCQDACEPGAIQFFTESDGVHYHTPYVDPAIKACTLCMKCTKTCPTGVLEPLEIEEKAKVRMASVELRKDLCLSYKAKHIRHEQALLMDLGRAATDSDAALERRGPCGECYTFCPLRRRAIKLEPGAFLAPLVFTRHCVGCGLCEEICRVMVRGEPAIRVVPTRRKI